jgi:cytochrome c peroxidase
MTIVQSKLKEYVHKGSMNSFEQLVAVFQTRDRATEMGNKPMDVLPVEGLPVLEKGESKQSPHKVCF